MSSEQMPRIWWSPSERMWVSLDGEVDVFEIYGEEELPDDAVRLVQSGDGTAQR